MEPSGSTLTNACGRTMRRRDGGHLRYFWRLLYEEVGGVVAVPASLARRGITPTLPTPLELPRTRAGATALRPSLRLRWVPRPPPIPTLRPDDVRVQCAPSISAAPHKIVEILRLHARQGGLTLWRWMELVLGPTPARGDIVTQIT